METNQSQQKKIDTSRIKCPICKRAFMHLDEVERYRVIDFHNSGLHVHYKNLDTLDSHTARYGKHSDWIPLGGDTELWKDYEMNR